MDNPRGPYGRHQVNLVKCPKTTMWRQKKYESASSQSLSPGFETLDNNVQIDDVVMEPIEDETNVMEQIEDDSDVNLPGKEPVDRYADDDCKDVSDDDEDEDFECPIEPDSTPIFQDSRLTLASSMLLISSFVSRHKLSGECLKDLLKLIEIHCPISNSFIKSLTKFWGFFEKTSGRSAPIEFHYKCLGCHHYNGKESKCSICSGNLESSYFILLSIQKQLEAVVKDYLDDILTYRQSRNKDNDNIEDVIDGRLYKETFDGLHFRGSTCDSDKEIHISTQINTDGVAIFRSSKWSVWPVYITINEIPPWKRYTRRSRIFAGLWFGEDKADMQLYMEPIVNDFKNLFNKGFNVTSLGNESLLVRTIVFSGVFDSPARSSVQSFIQFNGYYGCSTCLTKGENLKTSEKGRVTVFPFNTSYEAGHPETRSHSETSKQAALAEETKKNIFGVKGQSWLLKLPKFNIIRGVTVDYMHAVLLGVTKYLLNTWVEKAKRNEAFYIGKNLKKLNERLHHIEPPASITRRPRSLSDLSNWKASELRSFLIFYGVPVLQDILAHEYLEHFGLLSSATFILLKSSISHNEIKIAREMLVQFCCRMEILYGPRADRSNVHSLLHLADKVVDLGPLWSHSCFFYEDLNGDLRNLFHGTNKVQLQILKAVNVQRKTAELYELLIPGTEEAALLHDITSYHQIKKGGENISRNIVAVFPIQETNICNLPMYVKQYVLSYIENPIKKVYHFKRLIYHGHIVHSSTYSAAKCTNSRFVMFTHISTGLQCIGEIRYFIKICSTTNTSDYYMVIKEYEVREGGALHIKEIKTSDTNTVVPIKNLLNLCVIIDSDKQSKFMSILPNTYEKD